MTHGGQGSATKLTEEAVKMKNIKWVNAESAVPSSHWLFVTEFQAASVACDSLLDSITVRSTEIKQEN